MKNLITDDVGAFAVVLAFLVLFLLLNAEAKASDTYMVLGLGNSHFSYTRSGIDTTGNGTWRQEGFGFQQEADNNGYTIGIGGKLTRSFGWEIAYQDFGRHNTFAAYVDDDQYDPNSPTLCTTDPCPNSIYGYGVGRAQGLLFSVLPEMKIGKRSALFARGGATYYRATWEALTTNQNGNRKAAERWGPINSRGWSHHYGLGIRIGQFTLERAWHPRIRANEGDGVMGCCSAYEGVTTTFLSYRVEL